MTSPKAQRPVSRRNATAAPGVGGPVRATGAAAALALLFAFCRGAESSPGPMTSQRLVLVADVPLPGRAVRFDYQDIDAAHQRLFIAHMNDASVVVVSTIDGKVVRVVENVPTPRGVAVAESVKRVFVTSSPSKLVIIDSDSLSEVGRVSTGNGPDGVAWDPVHGVVGVSDQGDGALSLIAGAGAGGRRQVALGNETGNVIFDPGRGLFWITVEANSGPDFLSSVDPVAATIVAKIPLPGCIGAHGLRIHPDGKSALVACEGNSKLARIELHGSHALTFAASGPDPDVLAIDAGLGWLYAAAESGDVRIFDLTKPGLVTIGHEHPGDAAHSVAVEAKTHHVFFPLAVGPPRYAISTNHAAYRIEAMKIGGRLAGSFDRQPKAVSGEVSKKRATCRHESASSC